MNRFDDFAQWRVDTLERLQNTDPIEFEGLVAELFRLMGYQVETTSASRDEGVDLLVRQDGRVAVVQCKRYRGDVGQPVIRDLYGTMIHNRANRAYVVTTGRFSVPAQEWAQDKPIYLIDGEKLTLLIDRLLSAEANREQPKSKAKGEQSQSVDGGQGLRRHQKPSFSRDDFKTIEISQHEAQYGTSRIITLDYGRQIDVYIPPETKSGTRIRLRECGRWSGGQYGDLCLTIKVLSRRYF